MTANDRALTTSNVDPSVAAAMAVYERLHVVRNVIAPDLSDQELSLFAMVAQRSGLDPFARQIYAVKRSGRVTFQTGIDGYRSTAERTREYGGSDEPEFGPIVGGHPEWARVTVYRMRGGVRTPQTATAYWDEFHPGGNQPMWAKMPRNQLAKCAEALALRKAFPYVLADLYTDDEMDQAGPPENGALVQAASQPTARERLAARRAALEDKAEEPEAVEATEGIFAEAPDEAPDADRDTLLATLRGHASQSGLDGTTTPPQQARLKEAFAGMAAADVQAGLVAAFGHKKLETSAEAQAVVVVADSLGDEFQAAWAGLGEGSNNGR